MEDGRATDHQDTCHQASADLVRTHSANPGNTYSRTAVGLTISPTSAVNARPNNGGSIAEFDRKLMLLLCRFSPERVPMEVLQREFVGQYRWDQEGNRIKVTPQETGLSVDFVYFEDCTSLVQSLHRLSSAGKIVIDQDRVICIPSPLMGELLGGVSSGTQVLEETSIGIIVPIISPGPDFGRTVGRPRTYRLVGQRLTPLLGLIARVVDDYRAYPNLAATMLSASPFAQHDTEQYVGRILQTAPFSYIHVWAIRQSVRKKDQRSTEEVRRLFDSVSSQAARQESSKDLRINAQIGRLQAIYAAYLCHYGTLD
ncbi:hypothetical protein LTS16_024830 [Friedmanniomyces endolithicus]|nr:hypothetical protein LTR59_011102 [Friedmanniomyces endolithicus]KAK0790842.1 hypothetical protein LTR38_010459 [Friedmanniomyces endolithicus]KAK0840218.1 hypothetical protein LTR03_010731 [Friedmanniomyces endolithicus]KAK0894148.1 hypothetical protein LTR57_023649 [Friedmanniomyces endolithicus]KAK1023511.1 hypothetical protein LTS16_024830 [Friedmanniomyces endolithicus]